MSFYKYQYPCCSHCRVELTTNCPPEYQMSVKMLGKCAGFEPFVGYSGEFKRKLLKDHCSDQR